MPLELTDRETKLLRLWLDQGAAPGEAANAALHLRRSLVTRGADAYAIESTLSTGGGTTPLAQARRRVMPFGRHRGRRLEAIEPSYLRWALRECGCLSLGLRDAIALVLRETGVR